jgi:branched-subunit amino acid ABC-type transport system permease component
VRVSGALAGIAGILVRKKNNFRFVASLDIIMRSVSTEIDGGIGAASLTIIEA